jgi:hypothetical protein
MAAAMLKDPNTSIDDVCEASPGPPPSQVVNTTTATHMCVTGRRVQRSRGCRFTIASDGPGGQECDKTGEGMHRHLTVPKRMSSLST